MIFLKRHIVLRKKRSLNHASSTACYHYHLFYLGLPVQSAWKTRLCIMYSSQPRSLMQSPQSVQHNFRLESLIQNRALLIK